MPASFCIKTMPNLEDYTQVSNNFHWEDAEREFSTLSAKNYNCAFSEFTFDDKVALVWEGENQEKREFTFSDISKLSNKFGNYLKAIGVQKGDRVFFFLPRIPEIYYGFLGALKIGAVPGTLFPAFGPIALEERLKNSGTKVLVTNRELSERVDKVRANLPELQKVILVEDLAAELEKSSQDLEIACMNPEDSAFMLYTSATGNTPVCGIVIPHKAIVQQRLTAQWVLDLKREDVYWCTADPGWVTGIVYGIIAPWSLGITQVSFAGRFDPSKWYEIIQKYKVSVLYTAPTALRLLAKDPEAVKNFNISSLRQISSVGEALTPASIKWSLKTFKLPVYDTWWQTETGAMMVCNFPSLSIKQGSMGKPVPGIKALVVDENGKEVGLDQEGNLAFEPNWPSRMIDVWRNKARFDSYIKNGLYYSGDKVKKDKDGYFWFIGRADDIIKTSGERIAPFDVESSLMEHPSVLEVGVIGKPDQERGELIKAFIVLKPDFPPSDMLKEELKQHVKDHLAGHAYPREIEFVGQLPKNRAGKIVRRLLKARELGLPEGDTSTIINS